MVRRKDGRGFGSVALNPYKLTLLRENLSDRNGQLVLFLISHPSQGTRSNAISKDISWLERVLIDIAYKRNVELLNTQGTKRRVRIDGVLHPDRGRVRPAEKDLKRTLGLG